MRLVPMLAAFMVIGLQYKIAPVDAESLVSQSIGCLLVTPDKKGEVSTVNKVLWGYGINPGDHVRLRAYVFWDYYPHAGKDGDIGPLALRERSMVFLQTPPQGVRLGKNAHFASLSMIAFSGSKRDQYPCPPQSPTSGGVRFSESMKHSRRDSISLIEVIQELTRIRAGQQRVVGERRMK